jgi:protein-tyrosine-phosphatase
MLSVLFVCVENACRSQLAEQISNRIYGNKIFAQSAGSQPAKTVNPKAIDSLKRIGIVVDEIQPKNVTNFSNERFDYVVTMGCGDECPFFPNTKTLDWKIPDPKHMNDDDFDNIRDLIKMKINTELLNGEI